MTVLKIDEIIDILAFLHVTKPKKFQEIENRGSRMSYGVRKRRGF